MKRLVLPFNRAQAEHAAEVTEVLREEGPLVIEGVNVGLDYAEAICPACSLAFWVTDRAHSWGMCPECLRGALERI